MSGVVWENVRENHQETTRGVAQAVMLPIVRGNVRENSINPVDPVQCPGNRQLSRKMSGELPEVLSERYARENHQETTRGVAQAVILPVVRGNVRGKFDKSGGSCAMSGKFDAMSGKMSGKLS